jgi:hypothetical protein
MGILGSVVDEFGNQVQEGIGSAVKSYDKAKEGNYGEAAGIVYDTFAPLPLQALTYSKEAEGAFLGPMGYKNLVKAGMENSAKPFQSRFFGNRYEVSPSNAANVWWNIGSPTSKVDAVLAESAEKQKQKDSAWDTYSKYKKSIPENEAERSASQKMTLKGLEDRWFKLPSGGMPSMQFKDIVHPEEYPELYMAYPELFEKKVNLFQSDLPTKVSAEYSPKDFEMLNKVHDISSFWLNIPRQSSGGGRDLVESLLHEAQHYIQHKESGLNAEGFLKTYKEDQENRVKDILSKGGGAGLPEQLKQKNWGYRTSPYEREAYEASRRDVDPQYREKYDRKTEILSKVASVLLKAITP